MLSQTDEFNGFICLPDFLSQFCGDWIWSTWILFSWNFHKMQLYVCQNSPEIQHDPHEFWTHCAFFLFFRRYQRLSPDCLPLPTGTTGRKSDLTPNLNPTPVSNSNPNANQGRVSPNSDAKSRGGRLTSDAPSTSTSANHGEISGGDLLLQWGHNKRTRGPRTGQAGDDSASSHMRSAKIQRRSSGSTTAAEKLMPPPQLPVGSYTRGANLRSAVSLPNHHR